MCTYVRELPSCFQPVVFLSSSRSLLYRKCTVKRFHRVQRILFEFFAVVCLRLCMAFPCWLVKLDRVLVSKAHSETLSSCAAHSFKNFYCCVFVFVRSFFLAG